MRSRIAIFEGYAAPRRRKRRSMGAPLFNNPRMQRYGAPLFNNPRMQRYGAPLFNNPNSQLRDASFVQQMGAYGRGAYRVPSRYVESPYAYGPPTERGEYPKTKRRGYKVKRMKDTPAMKRAQARMKKAAKKCSRRRRGTYVSCMKRELKKGKSRR